MKYETIIKIFKNSLGEVGCTIYSFICSSAGAMGMVALLLYHFTALWYSKGDIIVSAICYLWMFFLVHYYTERPS